MGAGLWKFVLWLRRERLFGDAFSDAWRYLYDYWFAFDHNSLLLLNVYNACDTLVQAVVRDRFDGLNDLVDLSLEWAEPHAHVTRLWQLLRVL